MRTPFARVAIALTQADRKVEHHGSMAQIKLEEMDPAVEASKALGFYAKSGLFRCWSRPARKNVYAGWVSVYGFMAEEGSVNFDSARDQVANFRPDNAQWTDEWVPYGVIEPLLFACTGEASGLSPMAE